MRHKSKYQAEADQEEISIERPLAQLRYEERAKTRKMTSKEQIRQKEYQDSSTEELKSKPAKQGSVRTIQRGNECQSEPDRMMVQKRQEVEQLKLKTDLELRAPRKNLTEEHSGKVRVLDSHHQTNSHSAVCFMCPGDELCLIPDEALSWIFCHPEDPGQAGANNKDDLSLSPGLR